VDFIDLARKVVQDIGFLEPGSLTILTRCMKHPLSMVQLTFKTGREDGDCGDVEMGPGLPTFTHCRFIKGMFSSETLV